MIISGSYFYINVFKYQLPCLEYKENYVLTPYDHKLPIQDRK